MKEHILRRGVDGLVGKGLRITPTRQGDGVFLKVEIIDREMDPLVVLVEGFVPKDGWMNILEIEKCFEFTIS